ncbi:hypothetical protein DIPPA_12599 [Diplonema papillatum]|nr:hypothetical protein DIPPA_12599 [Diplonema papillatum]
MKVKKTAKKAANRAAEAPAGHAKKRLVKKKTKPTGRTTSKPPAAASSPREGSSADENAEASRPAPQPGAEPTEECAPLEERPAKKRREKGGSGGGACAGGERAADPEGSPAKKLRGAAGKPTLREELRRLEASRETAADEPDLDAFLNATELLLARAEARAAAPGTPEKSRAAAADVAFQAAQTLCLAYVQEDLRVDARNLLKRFGYHYRLSTAVLRYPLAGTAGCPPGGEEEEEGAGSGLSGKYVTAYDNALPEDLVARLRASFAPDARFWREHRYVVGETPYFSYRHSLDQPPANLMDVVVQHVAGIMRRDIAAAEDALYAEWWAHCRPHTHGHQLHFDADNEGKGGVRNPLANCIIYLSGPECGGPTLVTTQYHGDQQLSQTGWFVYPNVNRIVAYPANVLHGVIPGRSFPSTSSDRRITLMVALWGKTGCKLRPSKQPGASRPFPSPSPDSNNDTFFSSPDPTPYTWPLDFKLPEDINQSLRPSSSLLKASPVAVDGLWEDVSPELNRKKKRSVTNLTKIPHYDLCFQGF